MESQANPALKSRKLYLPTGIVQRDGSRVAFEIRHIASALSAAGQRSSAFDDEEACVLTQRVLHAVRQRFPASEPTAGELQHMIDEVLSTRGTPSFARSATA